MSEQRALACLSIAANVLCAGGVFTLPLISPVLAEQFKLTQPQLTSIVLAGMAGQYPCTPLVGKIVDRYGPWACSLIASLLFSLAFGCFSYQVHCMLETPPSPASIYLLVLLFALAGFATVFSYFSSLFAATRNFPNYPGAAAGTVMALFGLSPLFLSFVASSFFSDGADTSLNLVGFLAFLAIATGIVHLIGGWTLQSSKELRSTVASLPAGDADETTPLLGGSQNRVPGSLSNLIRDPYFWVLFLLLTVTLGPCEMVISNVGTIVLSLPAEPTAVHALADATGTAVLQIQTLAISNTITRLVTGPIADFISPIVISLPHVQTLRKHYISRAAFLVAPALVLAFAFLWMEIRIRSQADVWVLSVGTGIAYGATFTVLPSIISSVWGAENVGFNFGIIVFAPLLGTTIFSYLYAFIAASHTPAEGFCHGPSCWQTTFWVCGGLQVVAILSSLVLWRGWRGLL